MIPEASEVSARAPATARTAVASRAVSKRRVMTHSPALRGIRCHDPKGPRGPGMDPGGTTGWRRDYSRSRRITGYRSSAAATWKPHPSQNCGVAALVSSMGRVRSGYASTAANPRWASSSQTLRTRARGVARTTDTARGRDAGDDPGWRRCRQLRVKLTDVPRPWVRRQGTELGVGDSLVPQERHPCVRSEDPPAPIEERQLPGHAIAPWPLAARTGRERVPARRREQVVTGEHVGCGRHDALWQGIDPRSTAARSSAGSVGASGGRANGLSVAGGVRGPLFAGGGAFSQPGREALVPRSAFSQ